MPGPMPTAAGIDERGQVRMLERGLLRPVIRARGKPGTNAGTIGAGSD